MTQFGKGIDSVFYVAGITFYQCLVGYGCKNYSCEVLNNYALQHSYVLPPCLSAEFIWSCFVSVHCHPGNNIPVNLYTEQPNRLVKEAIKNLGANKTEKATS